MRMKFISSIILIGLLISCNNGPFNESNKPTNQKIKNELELSKHINSSPLLEPICSIVKEINSNQYFVDAETLKSNNLVAYEAYKYCSKNDYLFTNYDTIAKMKTDKSGFYYMKQFEKLDTNMLIITFEGGTINQETNYRVEYFDLKRSIINTKYEYDDIIEILLRKCINDTTPNRFQTKVMTNKLIKNLNSINSISDLIFIETIYFKKPVENKPSNEKTDEWGEFNGGKLLQKAYHFNKKENKMDVFYIKANNNTVEFGDLTQSLYSNGAKTLEKVIKKSFIVQ